MDSKLANSIAYHRRVGAMAKTLSEARTPRQLAMLRRIGNEKQIFDLDLECQKLFGCAVADLTEKAASVFIKWLLSDSEEICR